MPKGRFKVLVVDDEYWIREHLRSLLDWQAHAFDFLEPAEDGEEALARILKERPDIVITDISMPFVSGAELIRQAKENSLHDIVFIALSGYSDYTFVRSALVAGALDYILKPVTQNGMLEILSKAVSRLLETRAIQKEHREMRDQLRMISASAQDRELSALLYLSQDEKQQAQSKLLADEYELMFSGFSLVLFHTIGTLRGKQRTSEHVNTFVTSVKETILAKPALSQSLVFNYIYKTNEFYLITDLDSKTLYPLCKTLSIELQNLTNSPVTVIMSRHYYSFTKIRQAYSEIHMAFYAKEYRPATCVLKAGEIADKPAEKRISTEAERQFMLAVNTSNPSLFRKILKHEVKLAACIPLRWTYIEVRQTVDSLAWIIRNAALGDNSKLFSLDNLTETLMQAVDCFDMEEAGHILDQMLDEVFEHSGGHHSDSIQKTVLQIRQYIDANYAEELSLSVLARQFHVESSYLSKAFKQIVGQNMMLYITQKRIDKAIDYIRQGNLNLTEISQLVGYGDYTYFNRVFRKITGVSPRQFKIKEVVEL